MLESLKSWLTGQSPQPAPSLPEHGVLYFDHLYGQYLSLSTTPTIDHADRQVTINPAVQELVSGLVKKRGDASLTWNDLYTLELILTRLEPPEKLLRRVWGLRARYRDVAGQQEYEAYLASKPPELMDQPDATGQMSGTAVNTWRADIEYLLSELYLRYAIAPVRERQRNQLSKRTAYFILAGLGIALLFTFLAVRKILPWDFNVTTLTVIVFLGAIGGLVSVQQRFQNASDAGDQVYNVTELMYAKSTLVSAVSGATFAAVLYLLITAGLLEGGLFPELIPLPSESAPASPAVSDTPGQPRQKGISFVQFLVQTGPASAADYAKLMIWSFLSGFAERLIPDTLSRFVARKATET